MTKHLIALLLILIAMLAPAHARPRGHIDANGNAVVLGGRPAGCPRRFCACALSIKIFGRIVPGLNLAAAWPHRFQRAEPAPSMVAARSGHAFQLLEHISGNVWRVYDANSGHGRIRIHERSIAGYHIVDPHRSRMAMR